MSYSSWYVEAGVTHYNWSKEPTYRCPLADGEMISLATIEPAAAALGLSLERLARIITRAHRGGNGHRRRVDGKLTDECSSCGHKMKRLGYRAWIDEPIPASERTEGQAIGAALGHGAPRRTTRTTWHKTKREAEAWARHECKRAKAAA